MFDPFCNEFELKIVFTDMINKMIELSRTNLRTASIDFPLPFKNTIESTLGMHNDHVANVQIGIQCYTIP